MNSPPRPPTSWSKEIRFARELPSRWDLNLIADVIAEIDGAWKRAVEVYMGVAGAYFWRSGDTDWPRHEVRVILSPAGRPRKDDPIFEILYFGDTGFNGLTAADKCRRETAPAVLEAFLYNLASPDSDADGMTADGPREVTDPTGRR